MILSHDELTESIYRSLFELADPRSPEDVEAEYRERLVKVDNFVFEKGDEWKTKKGREKKELVHRGLWNKRLFL